MPNGRWRNLDDSPSARDARTPGLAEYNPDDAGAPMVSLAKAAEQLGICVGSAKTLALRGILPATRAMKGAQWLVPVEALTLEAVRVGMQRVVERRPKAARRSKSNVPELCCCRTRDWPSPRWSAKPG